MDGAELCLGALLVHALTLLTLCRYHLLRRAACVCRTSSSASACVGLEKRTKVYEQSTGEKGKTEHGLFTRGRAVRIHYP
ncbi:hypothetical protein V8C35DRAFT_311062 [Trichoderma chlorosporum]